MGILRLLRRELHFYVAGLEPRLKPPHIDANVLPLGCHVASFDGLCPDSLLLTNDIPMLDSKRFTTSAAVITLRFPARSSTHARGYVFFPETIKCAAAATCGSLSRCRKFAQVYVISRKSFSRCCICHVGISIRFSENQ